MNFSQDLSFSSSRSAFPAFTPMSCQGNSTVVRAGEQTVDKTPPPKLAMATVLGTLIPALWQAIMHPHAISSEVQISASRSPQVIIISLKIFTPVAMVEGKCVVTTRCGERFRANIAVFQPLRSWRNIVLLAGVHNNAMFFNEASARWVTICFTALP